MSTDPDEVISWIASGHGVAVVKYDGDCPGGEPGDFSVRVTSDAHAMARTDLDECAVFAIEPEDLTAARQTGRTGVDLVQAALDVAMTRMGY